jgi:hypothetical protein
MDVDVFQGRLVFFFVLMQSKEQCTLLIIYVDGDALNTEH